MSRMKPSPLDRDGAATLALQGLSFLAADPERLGRFLALTGCGPADLRVLAARPSFQASVLDHLMGDESLLLVFAAEVGIAPEMIAPAHALLMSDSDG